MSDRQARSAAQSQDLLDVARDLRNRAETLLERYAPDARRREDRLVMIGDAGVMEWAASVIEGSGGCVSDRHVKDALEAMGDA